MKIFIIIFATIFFILFTNFCPIKIETRVIYPYKAAYRIIRAGGIDYQVVWWPHGVYSENELSGNLNLTKKQARKMIIEDTCKK